MADSMRHDRQYTDPIPLRRVVPQRPLTEQELIALYGPGEGFSSFRADHHSPKWGTTEPDNLSPPGVVRPAEWDSELPPVPLAQHPPAAALALAPRAELEADEPVVIPMRRSRWTWAIVAAVVAVAIGMIGYALLRDDLRAELNTPKLEMLAEAPIDHAALEPEATLVLSTLAEPNRGPGIDEAETEASKPRPAANRTYTYRRPVRAAPAPAATPYPNLDAQNPPDLGAPPSDLRVPHQYERPAESIVREPGF